MDIDVNNTEEKNITLQIRDMLKELNHYCSSSSNGQAISVIRNNQASIVDLMVANKVYWQFISGTS
jgi:hypothetical protein